MVLKSFALLFAEPIYEKALWPVGGSNSAEHDDDEAGRGESRQQARHQCQASQRLSDDDEKCDEPRQMHDIGEESHCAAKPISAEPTKQLLRSMREDHHT